MSGSAHPGRKRPKKHEEEEHENHERWLVSYADMVTLLMCLFIVLFAMSQVDKAKVAARDRIDAALKEAGFDGAARYEIDERGLVVHIVADAVLFDAEQAVLRPEGRQILDAVAPSLITLPNVLRVEGHANHLPVTPGGQWPSNWELSAYRATTVLTYLAADGVAEPRMYAAGYGSTKPLVP